MKLSVKHDPSAEKLPEESRMTVIREKQEGSIQTRYFQVWRIEEFEKVAYPRNLYGQFFMGESYIVHYAYSSAPGAKDQHILFFFNGRECPTVFFLFVISFILYLTLL